MTRQTATQTHRQKPTATPAAGGLLQRKCACGNHTMAGGDCEECSKKKGLDLQTKLKINEPGDAYEQEADRIADQVMATPAYQAVSGAPPRIQRFVGQPTGQMDTVPASADQALTSPGRPLEPVLRQDMEQRFGCDFSRVRVHSGVAAEQSARDVNANAYTVGNDLVFSAGRFAPESREGGRLLAHELTHVVQQSGSAAAVQRQPRDPDPNADRAAAVAEAEAVASVTSDQIVAQSEAEDALKLKASKSKDKSYAWSLGLKDRARLQKSLELSPKFQQEIAVKIHFFSGEAKAAYIRTISPVLSNFPSQQVMEIFAAPPGAGAIVEQEKQELTCDIAQHQFPLEYEGEPAKARCMDIRTDPEYTKNYFDSQIAGAVGYPVKGTTWENVEYDSFSVMLVKYKKGPPEYFILDAIGNFYYGGKTLIIRDHTYLKRKNGLVYPIYNNQIYFSELLTPNILAHKNGMKYQIKELRDLYDLLQLAGAYTSIMGIYAAVMPGTFKTSINAFRRSSAKLPGSPLPGRIKPTPTKGGVPEPISDEATTQRIRAGRVGEIVGDFEISGDKGLKGKTFERNIYGISNIHGRPPQGTGTMNIRPIMQLARSFIQEAKDAGATQLRITGNVIRNKNVFELQGIVGKFGGTFRRTGPMEIEIIIPLR